uniref:Inositol polyphosphate-related phosphatase domain-containing protein n=1 Tax=Physcomitrium patens TaxID=3218 RepID=A0A7I4BC76_PHYPA
MRSKTAEMPKGENSGGTPAEPPLIDFGNDDHSSPFWSQPSPEQAQDVDPFSWTTDELFISATPKNPFGFEGLFSAAPVSNDPFEHLANINSVNGFAAQNSAQHNLSQGFGVGIDLLTGVPPVATRPGVGDGWVGSGFEEPVAPYRPSQSLDARFPAIPSDDTFPFDNNPFKAEVSTTAAPQLSPFYEEFSFKDALSEELPVAESPTFEDVGNAVDWTSITESERKGWAHEDWATQSQQRRGETSSPENIADLHITEKEFKRPVSGQKSQRSVVSVTEKDGLVSAKATVAQPTLPPKKPPPQLPTPELSLPTRPSASSAKSARLPPEFLASGGGRGVYRAPSRDLFYAGNPVALELRPRPHKEMNESIKTALCAGSSLWAAFDHGLKVWDIEDASSGGSEGSNNSPGDEDAAAYIPLVVNSGATMCLAMDNANQIIWSGHRDGRLRAWPLNIRDGGSQGRDQILEWDGHQAPVTAITITSYGELWTAAENGQIKAWSCEVISRALRGAAEDYQGEAASLSRSFVQVRGPLAGNNPSQTEVRILVADHSAGRVWSAGIYFITIWDARTREPLSSFEAQSNTSSQEFAQNNEVLAEEKGLRKEKGVGWLQRSRNAFMGAADAVRRAAAERLGQEEARRLETLAVSEEGTVWGGFGNGHLVKWDSEGTRQQWEPLAAVAVKCLLVVGSRLWVGYANGKIEVLSRNLKSEGCWPAQTSSIVHMARGGNYVFTLSADGGIRGWHVASLSPLDSLIQDELSKRTDNFTQKRQLRIFAGTWNVSQEKATSGSLRAWLEKSAADASLVCIGLQEMEMGAGSIGLAAVKETMGVGLLDKGSANGQWWLDKIGSIIGEGKDFERVASRQLAGLLIGVWVKKSIRQFVGDFDAAAVACGFGRTFGNKGAVGVKLSAFRRTICLVNSHFAAHMEKVNSRNSDFEYCYNQMAFGPKPVPTAVGGNGLLARGGSRKLSSSTEIQEILREEGMPSLAEQDFHSEMPMPELSDTDILVWFGDFNYRIDTTYDQAIKWISEQRYDMLLIRDQLRVEMTSGRTFPGMREAGITFPPTYKFDRGSQVYDTSEKKRVPAYCDRVVFRDSFDGSVSATSTSLTNPAQATSIRPSSIG